MANLFIKFNVATPQDVKSQGQGWTITAGFAKSPFGKCLIAECPRGICYLSFLESGHEKSYWKELQELWPKAKLDRDDRAASTWLRHIFNPSSSSPRRVFVRGTPFQVRVWRAMLQIPPGQTTSYGQLAKSLGKPSAARAVGSAVGQNCLAYLIPCHRVIRGSGVIGDYRWGSARKRAILAWETTHKPQALAASLL